MKYQIIPQDDTVQVKITDDDGISETVDMLEEIPKDSILVSANRKDVLGEINLEKMLANLEDCVDLLQITFNAVDGFTVQAKVQHLSTRFSDAMIQSNTTALDFKLATKTVVEAYMEAYGNLLYGEVQIAVDILTDIKPIAKKMVKKSDELVKIYDGLTKYTDEILQEVMNERSADEEKRKETKNLINQLTGSINAINQMKESLSKEIEEFQEEYNKLEKREMEQEKRAYNMQLASLIVGSISSLLPSFSNITSLFQDRKQDRDVSESTVKTETSAEDKAKRDYAENISAQESKKSQIKKIDERIKAIDVILDGKLYKDGENNEKADPEDSDTKKTAEELRKEKSDKTEEKAKLNQELQRLSGEEETLSNTLKGFGVAMEQVSGEVKNAAQEMQKQADSLVARMEEIRKRQNELKDQERKSTVQLAEYTAKMENAVMDENSLESAIQSLVIAIGCLRRVLAYLQEIKLFWMNVESFCDSLANMDTMLKTISAKGDKAGEDAAVYFKTALFVKGYIQNIAKWQTLYVIFTEYLAALSKVAKRLNESFEQALDKDRKVQWQLASKLAGQLKDKLRSEAAEMVN
ncbi:MAG: hypothetical protein J1F41_00540 [Lachnospiraceae bacterium]|nr:hypothetical protein [Lachnospiraceae bacterium]